ncbi:protein DpdE [Paraburkholderia sp. Cpub6]|uniref:protein DpdE n=1 Tax=Paraburkholderia sp. Cpub6 TaxID=2723094 RepID=UPI0016175C5C|nr:protein DpdE [Paraburkholderia sp. Cpub6]MBB5458754.1 ATP-dependent helicase HepA [Paraburkholderia sp. Cpub6]
MFCLLTDAEKDGLGKVIQREGSRAVVEYFDAPVVGGRHLVEVPLSSIKAKRLGRNTRVYTYNELSNQWRIGRVREDDGEGVEVRFANKIDVYLDYNQVFVRWKRPIQDPVVFLGKFVTETPQYAEARSGFLRNYLYQRGNAFGISALLSSSIELEPHQVDVVRRVLTDHSQRYLLADEVGLGKTIEAGIVIRQAVLDDLRKHRILVLVPHALVNQWREELIVRFGLRDFLDDSVFVLPLEDNEDLREVLRDLSLLVIDEAHHLADPHADDKMQGMYRRISDVARNTDRLLLLSATPILRNEAGFLRMLHLLDPVVYPLDDLDKFRAKILNRQALAETVAALEPSNSLFMDAALDDLIVRVPNDPRLVQLTHALREKLLDLPDENDAQFCVAVRQLRAHLSETYRLNRRILRNRRSHVEGLTPERKGSQVWAVLRSPMIRLESTLEDWRIGALLSGSNDSTVSQELEAFYWKAVSALSEDLSAFCRLCAERRGGIARVPCASFEGEHELLDALIAAIDVEEWMQARLNRLREGLRSLPDLAKAVIFCANGSAADEVFMSLNYHHIAVVRHDVGEIGIEDSQHAWREFLTNPEIRAIVCDQDAEEGINLQGGNKVVVHFDLPLQPNRIEQRLGRVDRYGSGAPVPSYVLLDEHAPLQTAWFNVVDQGWGVFDRSISSLQYLVEAELSTLAGTLIHGGVEALDALRDRLAGPSGLVEHEIKLIDQQDALDQLSQVVESDLDDLFEVDGEWKRFREAMLYWIEDTLLFRKVDEPRRPGTHPVDVPFRLHYCSPDADNASPTLISSSGFIDDFLGAIDFEAPGSCSTRPQSYPYLVHRPTAVKRGIRPLRYGTEFIEAIKSFSDLDDRGRSYAMWRQVFDEFSPSEIRICFRFDFVVETCLNEALIVAADNGQSSEVLHAVSMRRGDTLFPPEVMQVWVDEEGDELATGFVERFLSPEYAKQGGNGYIDKNLGLPYLRAFQRMAPDTFANWGERCQRTRDYALTIVMKRPELKERQHRALERAFAEEDIRYAQLETRIQSLNGIEAQAEARQLELEHTLNETLHRGISSPSVKVDVAGVVFLTSEPVSLIERFIREDA